MSWVSIVLAEATINLLSHPSVELADVTGFVAVNAATRVRSNTQSKWGAYSLAITPSGVNAGSGVYYQITGAAYTTYTFSVWGYGYSGETYRIQLRDAVPSTLATLSFVGTGAWQYVEVTGTTGANTTVRCYLTQNLVGGVVFYADGWQLEQKAYATTYADGDQAGCEWAGAVHASTSSRSAQSRAGGRVIDLTDYNICVDTISGMGYPPVRHNVRDMALQPGALMDNVKVRPRVITLRSVIHETDGRVAVHSVRKDLIDLIKSDAVATLQPFILRYNAMTTDADPYADAVECYAYYDTGLQGRWQDKFREEFGLRMIAYDPFFYEVGESAQALDTTDALANVNFIVGRIDNRWSNMAQGANARIWTIAVDAENGYIYAGGSFTVIGGNAANYVGRYDMVAGTWTNLGVGMGGGAGTPYVYALFVAPNGDLYAGGFFTTSGGNNTNHVARWTAGAWGSLAGAAPGDGVGPNGAVLYKGLAMDSAGNLYMGGAFTDLSDASLPAANYIAQFDTTGTWNALATGFDASVRAIAVDANDNVYAGGDFLNAGAVPCSHIAMWDGTAWNPLGTGCDDDVHDIVIAPNGLVYVGGEFDVAGGVTVNSVAVWNGESWSDLAGGMDFETVGASNWVRCLAWDEIRGVLYAGGEFDIAGGVNLMDRWAGWNGTRWFRMDIDIPNTGGIGEEYVWDIVLNGNDIYVAAGLGTAAVGGDVVATNDGTASAFPRIVVGRTGGTTAILSFIRNDTTGKEIYLDYDLQDGEIVTIDLTPGVKSITSSVAGNILGKMMPYSDLATLNLMPGNNTITTFVLVAGAPVITAHAIWRDTSWSTDGPAP